MFDADVETKWLDFGGGGVGGASWVELQLEPGQVRAALWALMGWGVRVLCGSVGAAAG